MLRSKKQILILTLELKIRAVIKSFGDKETNPNVLFDYQNKITETGNFEAYNYCILSNGDKENFNKWTLNNKKKSNKFVN